MEIFIIGPVERKTGGIAQYISQQISHIRSSVSTTGFGVSAPRVEGWSVYPASVLKLFADFARLLTLDRHDVIHVHVAQGIAFYRETLFGMLASLRWNAPLIVHVHGSQFDEFLETATSLERAYISWVFGNTDVVICLSEYWRTVLERELGLETVEVLPNAVATGRYDPQKSQDGQMSISFVSDLVVRKGVREFTEAIRSMDQDVGFRVDIAGRGPSAEEVERLARRHSIHYHGYVSEAEKLEILSRSDIFVLPSHAEGLPIVILEAMAGGNAIVTTRVGSIADEFGEENCVFVPPGDLSALQQAIDELLRDPERVRQMGRVNRELVQLEYSWDAHESRLIEIYTSSLIG